MLYDDTYNVQPTSNDELKKKKHEKYDRYRKYIGMAALLMLMFTMDINIVDINIPPTENKIHPILLTLTKCIYNATVSLIWLLNWSGYKKEPFRLNRLFSPAMFTLIPAITHLLLFYNDEYDTRDDVGIYFLHYLTPFLCAFNNILVIIIVLTIILEYVIRYIEEFHTHMAKMISSMFSSQLFSITFYKKTIHKYRKVILYFKCINNIMYTLILYYGRITWINYTIIINLLIISIYFFLEESLMYTKRRKIKKK